MTKKADIGGKRLISTSPNEWVRWLTNNPNLTVKEILNSDFQWIARENDVLIKVFSATEGEFLILNELQLRYDNQMPLRICAYSALARERYNLPVYPVLINILPNSQTQIIPDFYEEKIMGMRIYQNYQVVNLWEIEANFVFENNLSTLLPFVPILKGGGKEDIIRTAVIKLRNNETLKDLEPLLSFFASFVLDIPLVQQIMRWDMTILRESPWYQQILREESHRLVFKLIERRFGDISSSLRLKIQQLSVSQSEDLATDLLDITQIHQLETWLQENTNQN